MTGVVVRKALVTRTGMSVIDSFMSTVLLLTVEGTAVRPRPMVSSLVWDESLSVEDSVDAPTLGPDPWSVPETLVTSPTGEVKGGAEETDTSDWSVVGSSTLRGGVESEVSCDAEVC